MLGVAALAAALPTRIFAQTSTAMPPRLLQGVQAGDFSADGAVVWSRPDRLSRMIVDYATPESFVSATRIEGPLATEATDCSSRLRITGVAPGQTVRCANSRRLFVHGGDTIYADNPLEAERKLADGKIWRNTVRTRS